MGDSAFCCRGCEAVHGLLVAGGLDRYYELGGGEGHPVALAPNDDADHKWIEPIAARVAASGGLSRVVLDVQGVHCAACVWLIDRLFEKEEGGAEIVTNPAVGSLTLTLSPAFPLADFVTQVESFGYKVGPALKGPSERESDLVWRMGVCIAIAMNTMIFGIAIYAGLSEGPIYRVFHGIDFGLSLVSVAVGGAVFFRSAWQSLKRRVLHLDLPIAIGILLVFASSTATYFSRGGGTSYFDTLNVFIALMLVGRFLQERVLAKNRAMLLASDGADGLLTRRVTDAGAPLIACTEIAAGDTLLIAPKDLVPVDAALASADPTTFSLDWINGESAPRVFEPGQTVPAGAFNQGDRAVLVRAEAAFDASSIVTLLRQDSPRDGESSRATPWHEKLTLVYVAGVLGIAALTFAGWFAVTRDVLRTLDVVAAVLIVTCPCAFGIATPLAYELAQAKLRRMGLFVRTAGFLDRALLVERVVFDKTGTLTTGKLEVADPGALARLEDDARRTLYALASQSSHPKSRAIVSALEAIGVRPVLGRSGEVREIAGRGLELVTDAGTYRLGAARWATRERDATRARGAAKVIALAPPADADVVFTLNGAVIVAVRTIEALRADAAAEIVALEREGLRPTILSGDSPAATRAIANACHLTEDRALGGFSPEGKADWLREHDGDRALFVGDGINDTLAADAALAAGTPAIDRPFMAARSDFYLVTAGLAPIRSALAMARRLARVVQRNLALALAYNAVTIFLAVAGLMTPLLCAVLMPVSSISTVLLTVFSFTDPDGEATRSRSAGWKS